MILQKEGGVRYNVVCQPTSQEPARTGRQGPHATRSTPPSQKTRQRINGLLKDGLQGEDDVTTYLFRLAVKMHVRGLSTRDIEDALEVATATRLLSRTAASELTDPF